MACFEKSVLSLSVCHFDDNSDGNCPVMVTHYESTHRGNLTENFHRHCLLWNKVDKCGISLLEILWVCLDGLTCFLVDSSDELGDDADNSGSVTEEQRTVASPDLSRQASHDNFSYEGLGRFALISTTRLGQYLAHHTHGIALSSDVQTNVVTSADLFK